MSTCSTLKLGYNFSTENLGTFNTRLNASIFDEYVFTDKNGNPVDVLGEQNARTNIAPPIPQTKLAWNTNWFRNNHSASMSVSWFSAVNHDAQIVDLYLLMVSLYPQVKLKRTQSLMCATRIYLTISLTSRLL